MSKRHDKRRRHREERFVVTESLELGSERLPVEARRTDNTSMFGFWMYLMTDFVLFASLFAAYAVLRGNIFNGPSGKELFDAPYVLLETVVLLTSSFTCGLSLLAAHRENRRALIASLGATALLGAAFVSLELAEFAKLIAHGISWQTSGFLSAYFTLVGTHGLHVLIGTLWMLLLIVSIAVRGMTRANLRKLLLLSLFWHFLDIVWIFIFTIVYMMGIG